MNSSFRKLNADKRKPTTEAFLTISSDQIIIDWGPSAGDRSLSPRRRAILTGRVELEENDEWRKRGIGIGIGIWEEAWVVQDSSGNGMSGENSISCSANAIASVR